jgi:hypothetical protein
MEHIRPDAIANNSGCLKAITAGPEEAGIADCMPQSPEIPALPELTFWQIEIPFDKLYG